ncbi:hypothetical protein, partial [Escherichia coli]|uniref:hypothetical protein n=1 Tax=Escherichia coli TaxID=562 RepID=UPI00111FC56E
QPSGKNIIRWLLKKRTNGSVRYCQYTSWFVKNHHAVRQAKRKANMTYMKAYQKAWKEHRDRYQQDMEKLESENMELRRKLGEAKRDIDAYKRLFNGESHA